jgi:hypothetical protein
LFSFSLVGRAKQWFYTNKDNINTREKCSKAFLEKFFPVGKTNSLRKDFKLPTTESTTTKFLTKAGIMALPRWFLQPPRIKGHG